MSNAQRASQRPLTCLFHADADQELVRPLTCLIHADADQELVSLMRCLQGPISPVGGPSLSDARGNRLPGEALYAGGAPFRQVRHVSPEYTPLRLDCL